MIGVGVGLTSAGLPPAEDVPALSVVVAPTSQAWDGGAGAWFTAANFEATASNVTGTPSYTWEIVTGLASGSYFNEGDGPNSYNINSLGNDGNPNPGTVTLRCTVTDDVGSAVSNTVTVS